jgi:predicted DNA-binding transcriptional regulator AlpA
MDDHKAEKATGNGNGADHNGRSTGFMGIDEIVGPGKLFPIARSTWWKWVKDGVAPHPIKIEGRTLWVRAEVLEFIGMRMKHSRSTGLVNTMITPT